MRKFQKFFLCKVQSSSSTLEEFLKVEESKGKVRKEKEYHKNQANKKADIPLVTLFRKSFFRRWFSRKVKEIENRQKSSQN